MLGQVAWLLGVSLFLTVSALIDQRRKLLRMRAGWRTMTRRIGEGAALQCEENAKELHDLAKQRDCWQKRYMVVEAERSRLAEIVAAYQKQYPS